MSSFQDKAQGHIANLDKEVSTHPTHVLAQRGPLPARGKPRDHLLMSTPRSSLSILS
jgi:hypothetical protein